MQNPKKRFSESHEQVTNWPHGYVQRTAVTDMNIHHIEELILENRRIKVCDTASKVCTSAGSVKTVIHEHLLLKKVCAQCVPKMQMCDQRHSPFLCLLTIWTRLNWRKMHSWSERWLVTRHGYTTSLQNQTDPVWNSTTKNSSTHKIQDSLRLARWWQVSLGIQKG